MTKVSNFIAIFFLILNACLEAYFSFGIPLSIVWNARWWQVVAEILVKWLWGMTLWSSFHWVVSHFWWCTWHSTCTLSFYYLQSNLVRYWIGTNQRNKSHHKIYLRHMQFWKQRRADSMANHMRSDMWRCLTGKVRFHHRPPLVVSKVLYVLVDIGAVWWTLYHSDLSLNDFSATRFTCES